MCVLGALITGDDIVMPADVRRRRNSMQLRGAEHEQVDCLYVPLFEREEFPGSFGSKGRA